MAKIKICLDAGHYGKYNRSPAVPEYYESDMNWKLHNLLKKYLEQYGFEVTQTRKNQESDMGLTARGQASKGCDLFLSIHSNAVGSGVNESVDYPVVYIPIDGRGDKIGWKLAECIEKTMGTKQKGEAKTRKSQKGDWDYYGVIYGAVSVGVPGLILEHSFHTNTRSTKWLLDDNNLDKMAKAEAAIIAEYYGLEAPVADDSSGGETTPGNSENVLYRVQVGAYTVKKNAEAQLAKLKKAGFDGFIVSVNDGDLYRVQVGAYSIKENAEKQLAKVKAAGFSAFVTKNGGQMVSDNSEPEKNAVVTVQQWQLAAIADGFKFPQYGADGEWGNECVSVARNAIVKKRAEDGKPVYLYPNLTKIVQKAVGMTGDDVDGKCGTQTEKAIEAYQRKHGLTDDGEAGLNTWKVILNV